MARILLVEDNEMNRDMLSRRLAKRGHEVSMAVDGAQGVAMARVDKPDLILMDMSLPVLSGWDATIQMPQGPSFREFALLFHEIGDEGYRQIYEKTGTTCDTAEHEVQSGPGVPFGPAVR